jgi:hypothetical protein
VAQLEHFKPDPFNQDVALPKSVVVDSEEEHEIQTIIKSIMRKHESKRQKHCFIYWKGYELKFDE